MLLSPPTGVNALSPSVFRVTVASGTVASDLTGFPLFIDLADMPAAFWLVVNEGGGNVRAFEADETTPIPLDVVFCSVGGQKGSAFVKTDITTASDTEVILKVLPKNTLPVADGAASGRNAVWSDFTAVYHIGDDPSDRTGANDALRVLGDPDFFNEIATSPDINCHEGIATDGTYYYGFDSAAIRKFDAAWTLDSENTSIGVGAGNPGLDNLGGGCVRGGVIYVSAEVSGTGVQYLAKFNASDLTFIEAFDIDSFASGASDFCFGPDGLLYTALWGSGATIIAINPNTGAHVSANDIALSAASTTIQGITFWRGAFWLTIDSTDETLRADLDGNVTGGFFGPQVTGGAWEGIDVAPDGDGLMVLDDGGASEIVRTWKLHDYAMSSGGGLNAFAVSRVLGDLAGSIGTTWTVGVSVRAQTAAAQNYFLGVVPTGAYSSTQSVHIGVDENAGGTGQNRIAIFDGSNSWLYSASNAQISTTNMQRVNVAYNGTTARHLWVNGGDKGTDSGITSRGTGVSHINIAAPIENDYTAAWIGDVGGYVYLRESLLSDDWIAAEYDNLNAPSSFYSVVAV